MVTSKTAAIHVRCQHSMCNFSSCKILQGPHPTAWDQEGFLLAFLMPILEYKRKPYTFYHAPSYAPSKQYVFLPCGALAHWCTSNILSTHHHCPILTEYQSPGLICLSSLMRKSYQGDDYQVGRISYKRKYQLLVHIHPLNAKCMHLPAIPGC